MQTSMDLSALAEVYFYANSGSREIGFKEVYGAGPDECPSLHLRLTRFSQKGMASVEKRARVIKDIISLRQEKIFVYVTQAKPLRFFLWLKKLGFRIKIIVEPHSETEAWDSESLGNVDGIIYTTESLRNRLVRAFSIPADIPARVFYHRIRGPLPEAMPQGRPLEKTITLGYIGGLEAWKGVDTIIEALRFLPENIRVKFIGGEPGGPDHKRMQALAGGTGVSDRLSFTGRVPQQALSSEAEGVDIFILPLLDSAQGSLPLKLFDYMQFGKPIIASDQDSVKEVLDVDSALFFSSGSDKSLADQVSRLLTERSLGPRLAAKAFSELKKYAVDKWLINMNDFLETIVVK